MNKTYKISTIIPVYNSEKYLHRAFESLAVQEDFDMIEIILIDDGSTDSSLSICKEYEKQYRNIKVFHTENAGVSHARNFGLNHAQGDYIHFMDSDDILLPFMYSEFNSIIDEFAPDFIVGGVKRINEIKKTSVCVGPTETCGYLNQQIGQFFDDLQTEDERWMLDYIWNKFFKRTILAENMIRFNEIISLGEDFDFNCRYIKLVNSLYTTSSIVYEYSIRDYGLVTAFHKNPWIGREILWRSHIELYQALGYLSKERIEKINKYEGMLAFAALRSINNPRCKLNKKEMKQHLIGMIDSTQWKNILYYLRTSGQFKRKLFYLMLRYKNLFLTKLILLLDKQVR